MQIKLHKIFLISVLAFVMTSGSFFVSMADDEGNESKRLYEPGSLAGHTKMYYCSAKESTCTEDGWIEHYHCDACNRDFDVYQAEQNGKAVPINIVIPRHKAADPVEENRIEPTCTERGSYDEVIYCSVCGEELSRNTVDIEATGDHTAAEPVEENRIEPTCTEIGSYDEVIYCSVCGEELSRNTIEIEALGHDFGEWTVVQDATSTEDGSRERVCSRDGCDHSETEIIPATGEEPEEPVKPNESEEIKEVEFTPIYVTVDGSFGSINALVDEKGNALLRDFFWELEKGSNAEESVTMTVGGKSYTFTRYANGKVSGQLPPGFSVSGRDLKLSGLKDDLDIQLTDHSALGGGISEDYVPESSVGGGYVYEDGAYEEPVSFVGNTSTTSNTTTGDNNSNSDTGTNNLVSYAESLLNNLTGDDADNASDAALGNAEDKPSASSFFKADPNGGTNGGLMLSESKGGTPSKLVIAVDIALISALILGMAVLWKLGILKSLR